MSHAFYGAEGDNGNGGVAAAPKSREVLDGLMAAPRSGMPAPSQGTLDLRVPLHTVFVPVRWTCTTTYICCPNILVDTAVPTTTF